MATLYWYGGTGSWNAATGHWSTNSGNVPAADHIAPIATDDVVFDTLSNSTAYTVTVTASSVCQNCTVGNPLAGVITWTSTGDLTVSGNLTMATGMTNNWTGSLTFNASSGVALITSNSVVFKSNFTFNGSGATFRLADNLTIYADGAATGGRVFTNTAGTFDATTNNTTVTFSGSYSGSADPYTNVNQSIIPTSPITFYNLSRIPSTPSKWAWLSLGGDITVTNLFTVSSGATITNRVLIYSNVAGTQRTITAASISMSNVDFADIIGAGAASWDMSAASGGSGDCGNNTMKALGSAAFTTAADQHWTNASSSTWSTSGNWTSRVPLPQDNIFMDKAFGTSQTVTCDMPRLGNTVDWTGATWTTALTWASSAGYTPTLFGNLVLISGLTVTSVLSLNSRSSTASITSNTVVLAGNVTIGSGGGTYKLIDNFSPKASMTISAGAILTVINGGSEYIITSNDGQNPRWTITGTINLGTGTHILSSGDLRPNGTLLGTYTIKITDTSNSAFNFNFNSVNATLYNIWFSRGASTGAITIRGSCTFNNIKDDGTGAHSILFTAGTTQTVTTFTVNGSAGKAITLNSTNTTVSTLTKVGGGNVVCDWLNVQHIAFTPNGTWFARSSVNNQPTATAGSGMTFISSLPISGFFN